MDNLELATPTTTTTTHSHTDWACPLDCDALSDVDTILIML